MLIDNTASMVEDKLVLAPGEPWDIFFFVSEVVAGAVKGHFNDAHRSMPYVLRTVGLKCAKATLARRLGWRGNASARFVVARRAGAAVGAMLLEENFLKDGRALLMIEYMVVTASARRSGIGRMLVEYARRRAPAGGVECYCTEASRAMQRLLKRMGFDRTHRAREIDVAGDDRVSVPARWLWQP